MVETSRLISSCIILSLYQLRGLLLLSTVRLFPAVPDVKKMWISGRMATKTKCTNSTQKDQLEHLFYADHWIPDTQCFQWVCSDMMCCRVCVSASSPKSSSTDLTAQMWPNHSCSHSLSLTVFSLSGYMTSTIMEFFYIFSLTSQNRCRKSTAKIPSFFSFFFFSHGKVSFSLPTLGKRHQSYAEWIIAYWAGYIRSFSFPPKLSSHVCESHDMSLVHLSPALNDVFLTFYWKKKPAVCIHCAEASHKHSVCMSP